MTTPHLNVTTNAGTVDIKQTITTTKNTIKKGATRLQLSSHKPSLAVELPLEMHPHSLYRYKTN